ncbi:solute:sodium symporter family transporter [Alterisphingorhabdus coralli]|uniref:Solute:sodium symporter family transporter n=1 Tax=Alterisphingorhabdus coralli TaxID=3071408 RepID=A0AA97F555_9SPHN|nr:solute:sodium symporter family transporter [Parasphingorhabdus sp. SCSIO 66989]WOE74484.1 solute:sodium symporter family transporter [Parasphingorhabdus sp. SCSIO 66989]
MTADNLWTLFGAAAIMALVAWLSWLKTRGTAEDRDGYFLAGRGLTGLFIAGSMLLTNLSAEQLIGLNGSAYAFNMSAMAWEVTAGFAIIVMALVFLPRYLAGGYTTLPEFLSSRFDEGVRRYTVVLFLLGYGLVTIPSVLYSGALAVLGMFDVQGVTGLGPTASLVAVILVIGCVGGAYAVFGGLKAVAVSDTINGIGLLIIGFLVPIFGLVALGEGSFTQGATTVFTTETHKLNAIGSNDDPTPFLTLFTGMIFATLFYWGTNQYVIQRTLGAKSLAEGQKGVLLTGFLKLLVPGMMLLPGIIAFHLYGPDIGGLDKAYPRLVADVLPGWMSGFFLAVLLGAVFSSFNSLLNSAATLFALDIYGPMRGGEVDDATLVKTAKIASLFIAVASFIAAPFLQNAAEGLWQIIRIFSGFYNIPVIAIVLAGLFMRGVPPWAAKAVILFHVAAYGALRFIPALDTGLNFVHLYAILFFIEIGFMAALSKGFGGVDIAHENIRHPVELTPWRYAGPVSIILVAAIVAIYLLFSPIGLVDGLSDMFWPSLTAVIGISAIAIAFERRRWTRKYKDALA